jgi:hypothetical protein
VRLDSLVQGREHKEQGLSRLLRQGSLLRQLELLELAELLLRERLDSLLLPLHSQGLDLDLKLEDFGHSTCDLRRLLVPLSRIWILMRFSPCLGSTLN